MVTGGSPACRSPRKRGAQSDRQAALNPTGGYRRAGEPRRSVSDTMLSQHRQDGHAEAQARHAPDPAASTDFAEVSSRWRFRSSSPLPSWLFAAAWTAFGPRTAAGLRPRCGSDSADHRLPCALGLATPISSLVGVQPRRRAGGVLIKNAEALERMERVDTLIVDKTGFTPDRAKTEAEYQYLPATECTPKDRGVAPGDGYPSNDEHPLAAMIITRAPPESAIFHTVSVRLRLANRQGRAGHCRHWPRDRAGQLLGSLVNRVSTTNLEGEAEQLGRSEGATAIFLGGQQGYRPRCWPSPIGEGDDA